MTGALVIRDLRGAIVGPIDLAVEPGAGAAITGASGAGKSLLLRMIADLDPSEGEVCLGDLRRAAVPAPLWRAQVIYLAAEAGWWAERVDAHFAPASLPEATALAARLGPASLPEATALAARLGLTAGHLERPVRTLSTGEKQRLALVRALVRHPRALLLDEPTGALDPESIGKAEELLRETMASGTILVLVTHDAAQAGRLGLCRHIMAAGRLTPASGVCT